MGFSRLRRKQQLQFLLFPDGMSYSRKNDQCQTSRIDEVFLAIARHAHELTQNKNGDNAKVLSPSVLVQGRRQMSNYFIVVFSMASWLLL